MKHDRRRRREHALEGTGTRTARARHRCRQKTVGQELVAALPAPEHVRAACPLLPPPIVAYTLLAVATFRPKRPRGRPAVRPWVNFCFCFPVRHISHMYPGGLCSGRRRRRHTHTHTFVYSNSFANAHGLMKYLKTELCPGNNRVVNTMCKSIFVGNRPTRNELRCK